MLEPTTVTIDDLHAHLERLDPTHKDVYYALTRKNHIAEIIATPNIFGLPASPLPANHSKALTDALFHIVSNATSSVDIMTLGVRFPGGEFRAQLKAALKTLAESKRAVTVRIAFGQPPKIKVGRLDILAFLKEITSGLGGEGRKLKVYAAQFSTRDDTFKSWNHAKFIAADASVALIGGHNLYDGSYLSPTAPVFDLSLKVEGPAAGSAQKFADRMWAFIKTNNKHDDPNWQTYSHSFDAATSVYGNLAAEPFSLSAPEGKGTVPILAVANPGYNLSSPDGRDASREALLYFLEKAQRTVYISQQDVMNWPTAEKGWGDPNWDVDILSRLAKFIRRGGRVMLVISTPNAVAEDKDSYSNDISIKALYSDLRSACAAVLPITPDEEMGNWVKERVFLSTIRFNETDAKWPNGRQFANHAKFWMIDERVFYVGSHNWYPLMNIWVSAGSLQEYGLIVDDAKEAARMIDHYWWPLVRYSSLAAVSGTEWGVPAEQTTSMPWGGRIVVDAKRRLGEAFRDSTDGDRTYITKLTGTGSMVIHSAHAGHDPAWVPVIPWRREATAKAGSFSGPRSFPSAGPVIQEPRSAFALDDEGYVHQCYFYDAKWETRRFAQPKLKDGTPKPLRELGPMLYHDDSLWPFRFFAVDRDGRLWDCYYSGGQWAWQEHVKPDDGVAQLGPIVYQRQDSLYPLRMFYRDGRGNVVERRWHPSAGWLPTSHGAPAGHTILSIGPMLFDATGKFLPSRLQIFCIGSDHQLFTLHAHSNGFSEWKAHFKLPYKITQLGPAFLVGEFSGYPAKMFVLTTTAEEQTLLFEHCWNKDRGWDWVDHGNPGKKIAGIGPRTGSERPIVHPVRVFATTTDGWTYEFHYGRKGWQWQRHVATN